MVDYELYHYGVKGMKWGVRKSLAEIQADRLARYKRDEISKVERRKRWDQRFDDRDVARKTKKFNRALEKHGVDSKKANRAKEKLIKAKTNAIVGRKLAEAEIKRIGKMSLSDVDNEQRMVGERRVQAMMMYSYANQQRNVASNNINSTSDYRNSRYNYGIRTSSYNSLNRYSPGQRARIARSNANNITRNMDDYKRTNRLGSGTINEIRKKAEREARRSVGR